MELTQEQNETLENILKAVKEAINKINKIANKLCVWIRNVISKIKEALFRSWDYFKNYIMELPPKQRYKLLKSMGIKNYIPFFRRDRVMHCRNNC